MQFQTILFEERTDSMTAYHGGKQKTGIHIANAIVDEALYSQEGGFRIKGYCEPFCGMLGVYQHVPDFFDQENITDIKYLAGDSNKSVIMMWQNAQNGIQPEQRQYSKKEFMQLAGNGKSSAEKGFVGHLYGYMGKYFKPFDSRIDLRRVKNASERVLDIGQDLESVKFTSGGYNQFDRLRNYVIYCDPPYEKQNYYYDEKDNKQKFDHKKFWDWCIKMSKNNVVIISEYKAPPGFECIWRQINGKEKLFVYTS